MQRIVRHTLAIVIQVDGDLAEAADLVGVHRLEAAGVWSALARQALAAWEGEGLRPPPPYEGSIHIAPHARGYQIQIVWWWITRQAYQAHAHDANCLPS